MYTMKADGVLFYDPSANDPSRMAMGTEVKFELNKAGSLTFTLPPDNVVYHALRKRKSVVQLYQDGEMLFQGRVIDTVSDLQNMQEVYCEGDLNLLMDSVQPAMEFDGTAEEYLRQAISNHNAVMEADKQFVVGDVTAVEEKHKVKVESTDYTDTLGDLRSLLVDEFGGYLRVRYSGGTRYLDYIKEYTNYSGQSVKFGVNLVDIEKRVDTQKFFTILLPLGKIENGARTTIAQVNSGSIYLEDVAAVSQYGRIIQPVTFDNVNDPQELLEKAQEYQARMRENRSVTVRAVDMKIVNPDIDSILLGDRVMLDSLPHDLNEYDICAKVVLLIDTPDQSEYTFGIPPDPLTDQVASRIKQTNKSVDKLKDWLTVTDTELTLAKQWISETGDIVSNVMFKMDAMNANILLKADQTVVNEMETRISNAEILIDGANAKIDLKADRTTVTDLEYRVSNAEILIDGANAAIGLKADQTVVSQIDTRMSAAEVAIDGLNAEIKLVATQKTIDDLVERLSEAEIEIDGLDAKIKLLATESSIEDLVTRITAAEVAIDGANSTLDLWAGELDAMGNRLSGAEVRINGAESAVEILAEEIWLAGYVKASDLETETLKVLDGATLASFKTGSFNCSGICTINTLYATGAVIGSLIVNGSTAATEAWVEEQGYLKAASSTIATKTWVNDQLSSLNSVYATRDWVTGTATRGLATEAWVRENFSKASATYKPTVIERYGSVSGNSIPVQALNESGTVLLTGTVDAGDVYSSGSTAGANGVTLSADRWQRGACVVKASNGKSLTVNLPTFSVSGGDSFNSNHQTTVHFYTSSVTGPLKSKAVDATPVYNSGYDAGYSIGETTGYSVGYAQAKPASVSRTAGYDASNNAYNVTVVVTSNDNTTRTYALESISAREARNAGFNSGYDSGYTDGQASIDTGAYYDEGYEIGYSAGYAAGFKAAKDAVKVTAGISWSNPAQYYAMVRYWGRATINGEEVGYAAASESKNISGYV